MRSKVVFAIRLLNSLATLQHTPLPPRHPLSKASQFASPMARAQAQAQQYAQYPGPHAHMPPLHHKPPAKRAKSTVPRKDKSLSVLCQSFMELYRNAPPCTEGQDNGAIIEICELSTHLDVKRRRIYDIINIMEALNIVSRMKKNTYRWHGSKNLPQFFARIQQQGFAEKAARETGDKSYDDDEKIKGMAATCQKLIQHFLVTGYVELSLTDAAEAVLGPLPEQQQDAPLVAVNKQLRGLTEDEKEMNTAAQKAMKTKIRRMYDIANVLQSLGIIRKENVGSTSVRAKPSFRWVYGVSPQNMHHHLPPNEREGMPPMPHQMQMAAEVHHQHPHHLHREQEMHADHHAEQDAV